MARGEKLFRATALVTVVIIISKLCGFVRDMITAGYFGTGVESDAYTAAYSMFYLPVLLFNSCITSTLIPMFVQTRERDGLKAASRFGSNAFNLFGILALIVAALMFALAGPINSLVYSGFSPEKLALTTKLTRIMMLSLVFNITSIIMSSLLNAQEKFIQAQLTGFPLSFAVIIAAVLFSEKYGITALAWGVFASGILQVLVQLPFFGGWFRYTPRVDIADPRFKRLLALALPAILSMAVSELNHMIDHWLASGLEDGAMAALNYGYKLITFITGIMVVPLITIMFSRMSRLVSEGDTKGIIAVVRRCIEVLAAVLGPIIVICALMNEDVIRFAYGSGQFDNASIKLTAGPFLFYVIGVLGFGIRDLLNRTFHAMQDTKTPFRVACVAVILNIVLNFILRELMGVNGLALATSMAGTSAMVIMLAMLRKRLGRLGLKATLSDAAKILVSCAVCGAVCLIMGRVIPGTTSRILVFFRLAAVTVVSVAAYCVSLIVQRERQMKALISMAVRRGK